MNLQIFVQDIHLMLTIVYRGYLNVAITYKYIGKLFSHNWTCEINTNYGKLVSCRTILNRLAKLTSLTTLCASIELGSWQLGLLRKKSVPLLT